MRILLTTIFLIFITDISLAQLNIEKGLKYWNNELRQAENSSRRYNKRAIQIYTQLGRLYHIAGDFQSAEEYLKKGKDIFDTKLSKNEKLRRFDFDLLDELAYLYINNGNFQEAKKLLDYNIGAREEKFSKTNLFRYRSHLYNGYYFLQTEDKEQALESFKKFILHIKNSNHTNKNEVNRYANAYEAITTILIENEDFEEALKFAKKNHKWQHHQWVRNEAGDNNLKKIASYNFLSICYRMLYDLDKAKDYNDRAFALYSKKINDDTHYLVPLLMNRGFIYFGNKEYDKAEEMFMRATEIQLKFIQDNFPYLSEYEKENFYKSFRENFDLFNAFVAYKLNQLPQQSSDKLMSFLYDVQIKTKALILSESNKLIQFVNSSDDPQLKHKLTELKQFKNAVSKKMINDHYDKNDPEIMSLNSKINNIEKEIAKAAASEKELPAASMSDIQKVLKKDEAAIEVLRIRRFNEEGPVGLLSENSSYLFLIIKNSLAHPEFVIVNNGKHLEEDQFRFYQNARKFNSPDAMSYGIYWEPIANKLEGKTGIFFSPDGIYNLVNLNILFNPNNNKYLLDEVNLVNLTNTKFLVSHNDNRSLALESALLLGRPNYNLELKQPVIDVSMLKYSPTRALKDNFRSNVADLPGTEAEVKGIMTALEDSGIISEMALWNDATEEFVKTNKSKNIFHIATHGFFFEDQDKGNPMMNSGLLLAGVTKKNTSGEDGILTAYEASTLDLSQTNLVVLSACETGLGKIKNGEGVYGLQRAFEVAGVKYILMSLWKVDDQATKDLMTTFYEHLLKTKDVHNSFKEAQLKIRQQYKNPSYWGAFKLIGY